MESKTGRRREVNRGSWIGFMAEAERYMSVAYRWRQPSSGRHHGWSGKSQKKIRREMRQRGGKK